MTADKYEATLDFLPGSTSSALYQMMAYVLTFRPFHFWSTRSLPFFVIRHCPGHSYSTRCFLFLCVQPWIGFSWTLAWAHFLQLAG